MALRSTFPPYVSLTAIQTSANLHRNGAACRVHRIKISVTILMSKSSASSMTQRGAVHDAASDVQELGIHGIPVNGPRVCFTVCRDQLEHYAGFGIEHCGHIQHQPEDQRNSRIAAIKFFTHRSVDACRCDTTTVAANESSVRDFQSQAALLPSGR